MIQHQPFFPVPNYQQKPQTGFVVVPTEEDAIRYPMAPGTSFTFKVEGQKLIIEKTMGFSQLDSPQIKRYRLVEEEPPKPQEEPITPQPEYALKADIERLEEEVKSIKALLPKKPARKKEEESDE